MVNNVLIFYSSVLNRLRKGLSLILCVQLVGLDQTILPVSLLTDLYAVMYFVLISFYLLQEFAKENLSLVCSDKKSSSGFWMSGYHNTTSQTPMYFPTRIKWLFCIALLLPFLKSFSKDFIRKHYYAPIEVHLIHPQMLFGYVALFYPLLNVRYLQILMHMEEVLVNRLSLLVQLYKKLSILYLELYTNTCQNQNFAVW